MKNPSTLFLLALALGVGSAGITSSLLMQPTQVPQGSSGEVLREPLGDTAISLSESEFLERLQVLREENANLRDRLIALEQSSGQDLRKPIEQQVTRAEFEAFKREVRAFLDAGVAFEPESKEFKTKVANLMESIRKQEAVEEIKAMQANDAERLEDRVKQWDEWLGFNEYQRGEFRLLLSTRDMHNVEILRMWSEGADDQAIGEAKRDNEARHQAAVAALLTPQQLQVYQEKYASGGRGK